MEEQETTEQREHRELLERLAAQMTARSVRNDQRPAGKEEQAGTATTARNSDLPDPFNDEAPVMRLLPGERPNAGLWRLLVRIVFLAAGAAALFPRSIHFLDVPDHVQRVLVPTLKRSHVLAEGQLVPYPDAVTHVGSDIGGTVVRLQVEEKSKVRRGDLIAEIRSDEQRAAVTEARAQLAQAEAEIRLADAKEFRSRRLQESSLGSAADVDKAVRDRDTAEARRRRALASIERRESILAKTRISAPIDGTVISRSINTGDTIKTGTEIVTIVDLERTRIESEVDEFDIGRIKLGDRVRVTAEGFTGKSWQGEVEEIPDAVVARRLRPQDPSRMVDSRVLLVKIILLEPSPLKLGQRLEVEINPAEEPAKKFARR